MHTKAILHRLFWGKEVAFVIKIYVQANELIKLWKVGNARHSFAVRTE